MSEVQNAGETQAATATTAPAPEIPPGKTLVDTSTWEQAKRNAERIAGMQKYYEAGLARGIKSPDDFARLAEPDEPDDAPKGKREPFDPKKVEQIASQTVTRTLALERHNSETTSESTLIEELVGELAGKNATEFDKDLIRSAAKAKFLERAQRDDNLYPTDHPLHTSHFRPVGREGQKAILAEMRALRDKGAAQAKEQRASAALGATTPAGRSGEQGTPQDNRGYVSPSDKLRQQAANRLAEVRAERAGTPP